MNLKSKWYLRSKAGTCIQAAATRKCSLPVLSISVESTGTLLNQLIASGSREKSWTQEKKKAKQFYGGFGFPE